VTLRKAGFSNRLEFDTFISRYFICLGKYGRDKEGIRDFCQDFFSDEHDWALGHKKIFLRDAALTKIQEKQAELCKGKALLIQAYIRAFNARCKLAYLYQLYDSSVIIQKYTRQFRAVNIYNRLIE